MKDKETETETDRLLEALKKKRQEKAMVQFFKVPFVLVRENPVRLAYGWFMVYISAVIGACLILIILIIYLYSRAHEGWSGFVAPFDAYILACFATLRRRRERI